MTNAAQFAGLTDQVATGPFHEFDPLFTEPEVAKMPGSASENVEDVRGQIDTGPSPPSISMRWQKSVDDFQRGAAFIENGFQRPASNADIYNAVNKVFGSPTHFSDAEADRADEDLWRSMTPDQHIAQALTQ